MTISHNSSSLRLLMATPRYFPYAGGIESHVYEVGRRLVQAGVDLTILTTDPGGKLPRAEESERVKIRRVRAWPAQKDYYISPGVYNTIVSGKWDLVHCQGSHTFVAPTAMLAAWRTKIPYVVTFHTGGHSSPIRNALRGIQWRLISPLLSRAECLIGVSEFEVRLFKNLLALPQERFVVIPNGGHLPKRSSATLHDRSGDLIISVGRLERYKGHHRIIAALPKVIEHRPDARLLILGAGPFESELHRLAEEHAVSNRVEICAVPAADRERMASLLSQAALVVLFSEYEAHPVAVMEALALGRPVLVADTSGLRELAERQLVQAIPLESTPCDIAVAILSQLRQPFLPKAIQLPTWDDCAANLLSVYRNIVEKRQSAS